MSAKLPAHKPSVIYFEHYLHNIFKIPIFTSASSATSLIRNTVASCLYYPNSHSAGFWFHFCHPSSLVFNTAAALVLVKLKPDFKCFNDSHFHSQFKPRSLQLIAYAILCKLGLDSFPLLSIFIVSALATLSSCSFKYSLPQQTDLAVPLPGIFFSQIVV